MLPLLVGCPLVIALLVAISAFAAWIFWLLWGYVAVPVFGAPAMTFYQAWALWFLISMVADLFKRYVHNGKD